MSTFAQTAGAGLIFGAALTASGVYAPSVIVSQLQLKDFHMLTAFLCASASSAVIMAAFERFSIVQRQARKNSSTGLFGPYDANVAGGLLMGFGMATTGACPGTVLVQLVTGVKSGVFVAIGGVVGGILYAKFGKYLTRSNSTSKSVAPDKHTIYAKFDISPDHVLLVYEIMCVAIIVASTAFGLDRASPWLHPVLGGSLIGGAQAASLLLTGNPIGVSGAYEEAGQYFWRVVSSGNRSPRPPTRAMTFASGILAGSFMLAQWISAATDSWDISPISAMVGGCGMIIGARLAGGCTSGHGISGMSSFSISSVITVAAMFGGGIATALLLG